MGERLWREFSGDRNKMYLMSIKFDDPVLCLRFKPEYKERFQFKEGQYLYLNCPHLSENEWHPFTISSAHGDLVQRQAGKGYVRYPRTPPLYDRTPLTIAVCGSSL